MSNYISFFSIRLVYLNVQCIILAYLKQSTFICEPDKNILQATIKRVNCFFTLQIMVPSLVKHYHNTIDWRDKTVVSNVDISSLRAPWQNGSYTNKHTEQHKNTPIRNLLMYINWYYWKVLTETCLMYCYSFIYAYIPSLHKRRLWNRRFPHFRLRTNVSA